LILLVQLGVPGVRSRSARGRRKIARVYGRIGVTGGIFRSALVKFSRSGGCGDRGVAMVGGSAQSWICTRGVHVLRLCGDRTDVPFVRGSFFLRRRTSVDPAVAVITDVYIVSHVYLRFVHVVNHIDVYVGYGAVVKEMAVVPAPAFKAVAEVTETIVDAAIEPYGRAPIAVIPNKTGAAPTPVARRPEETYFRSFDPRAGHPVITVVAPAPISGRPDVAVTGANRLLVNGKRRRRDGDRYTDLREGRGRKK